MIAVSAAFDAVSVKSNEPSAFSASVTLPIANVGSESVFVMVAVADCVVVPLIVAAPLTPPVAFVSASVNVSSDSYLVSVPTSTVTVWSALLSAAKVRVPLVAV